MMTTAALGGGPGEATATARQLGVLIADMHAALASTASTATSADAGRWHAAALTTLDTACALTESESAAVLRTRRQEVAAELAVLSSPRAPPSSTGTAICTSGRSCAAARGSSSPISTAIRC